MSGTITAPNLPSPSGAIASSDALLAVQGSGSSARLVKAPITNAISPAILAAVLGYIPASPIRLRTFAAIDPVYGAYFDGTSDDQPGITAAIAAARAAGGGDVLLPAGSGCLASTLLQPYSNVRLIGAGTGTFGSPTGTTTQVGTTLTWIGAAGGTMAAVGPASDPVAGQQAAGADVRGVLFNANKIAAIGLIIRSVVFSVFDVGAYNALQCNIFVTTSWLAAQTASGSSGAVNCDTQHNDFLFRSVSKNHVNTSVATTVGSGGSATVALTSATGFLPFMQVRFGSAPTASANYYIVQSVSGNNVTFTTTVTQAEATAGNNCAWAPRGVYLHGQTTGMIPTGYFAAGSGNYPALEVGNVSFNRFARIFALNQDGGDGVTFGFSDNNVVEQLVCYNSSTGYGLVFDGTVDNTSGSIRNRVNFYSGGSTIARGTTSRPSGGSTDNYVLVDVSNGTTAPIIETGAVLRWANNQDTYTGETYSNPIITNGATLLGMNVIAGTAAPTTGAHLVGDIVINTAPAELGTTGSKYLIDRWRCTVAGTPGTWLPCRVLTGN